jgi:hypothetical protein
MFNFGGKGDSHFSFSFPAPLSASQQVPMFNFGCKTNLSTDASAVRSPFSFPALQRPHAANPSSDTPAALQRSADLFDHLFSPHRSFAEGIQRALQRAYPNTQPFSFGSPPVDAPSKPAKTVRPFSFGSPPVDAPSKPAKTVRQSIKRCRSTSTNVEKRKNVKSVKSTKDARYKKCMQKIKSLNSNFLREKKIMDRRKQCLDDLMETLQSFSDATDKK